MLTKKTKKTAQRTPPPQPWEEQIRKDLRHARHSIKTNPQCATSHYLAGKCYTSLNRKVLAEHHLRKAIKFNSDLIEAYRELGLILIEQGRIDSCKRLIDRLSRKAAFFPSENISIILSAMIHLHAGEIAKAKCMLKRNLPICWNEQKTFEILRFKNPPTTNTSSTWLTKTIGKLKLSNLISLPENTLLTATVIAQSEQEVMHYLTNVFSFDDEPHYLTITKLVCPRRHISTTMHDFHGVYGAHISLPI